MRKPEEHFKKYDKRNLCISDLLYQDIRRRSSNNEQCDSKKLYHTGYTNFEDSIQEGGRVLRGFEQNRGRQAVHFTLVSPVGKNPEALIYVADMERAQEDKSSASRLSTFASSVSTRFPNHASKGAIHLRGNSRNVHEITRCSCVFAAVRKFGLCALEEK